MLGTREVASALGVCQKTVREIISRGELPSHRVGGALRVTSSDLDAYIESTRIEVTPAAAAAAPGPRRRRRSTVASPS